MLWNPKLTVRYLSCTGDVKKKVHNLNSSYNVPFDAYNHKNKDIMAILAISEASEA